MKQLQEFAELQLKAAELQLKAAQDLLEKTRNQQRETTPPATANQVYIKLLPGIIGLSEHGIRYRIRNGLWIENVHYRHEQPGNTRSRLIFDVQAINQWLQNPRHSRPAYKSTGTNSASGSSTRAKGATKA